MTCQCRGRRERVSVTTLQDHEEERGGRAGVTRGAHLWHRGAQVPLAWVVRQLGRHLSGHAAEHRIVRTVSDDAENTRRILQVFVAREARSQVKEARGELEAVVATDDPVVTRVGHDVARVHHEEARRLDRKVEAATRLDREAELGRRLLTALPRFEARRAVHVSLAALVKAHVAVERHHAQLVLGAARETATVRARGVG